MSSNPDFDRWYAARKVRLVLRPSHQLETFGSTLVNYHLITELPDRPGKVRVREGRLEAHQPQIITPYVGEVTTEGISEEGRAYLEWLRQNVDNMRILRYGYHLKTDNFSEQIVTDSMAVVTERVKQAVIESGDKFSAVVQGEDEPWDVAIIELWRREVDRSAERNIRELQENGKLFRKD